MKGSTATILVSVIVSWVPVPQLLIKHLEMTTIFCTRDVQNNLRTHILSNSYSELSCYSSLIAVLSICKEMYGNLICIWIDSHKKSNQLLK